MCRSSIRFVMSLLAVAAVSASARAEDVLKPAAAPMAEPAVDFAPTALPPATIPAASEAAATSTQPAVAEPSPSPQSQSQAAAQPSPIQPAVADTAQPTTVDAAQPAAFVPAMDPPAAGAAPVPAADAVEQIETVLEVQPSDMAWSLDSIPQAERAINIPFAQTTRKHALLLIVDHRAFQAAFNKNTWHDFFGLDSGGVRVGLGLRFGILDGLDVGIYRLSNASDAFDTYEIDMKWRFLRADRHYLDVAIRAGLTWFSQRNADDAVGGFGQLLISRMLFKRLTLGTGVLFHSDSSGEMKSQRDTQWSLAIPGAVEIRILPWLAWNVEASVKVAGYGAKWPSFSTAVKFLTPRHAFSLILTNTQHVAADGLVANSNRDYKNLIIGFQIQREFPL